MEAHLRQTHHPGPRRSLGFLDEDGLIERTAHGKGWHSAVLTSAGRAALAPNPTGP